MRSADWTVAGRLKAGFESALPPGILAEGEGRAGAVGKMAYQSLRLEYLQIPPVSRAYTTACVLTTAAVVSSCGATSSFSRLAVTGSSEKGFGPRRSPVGLVPGVGGDIRS